MTCPRSTIRSCVRQGDARVNLEVTDGSADVFDLAVHAKEALRILGKGATTMEREIIRHFQTSENVCVLHSDMLVGPHQSH